MRWTRLEVRRTRRKVKGGWAEGTPKSEKSRRRVDLPNWLAEEMHDYLATHPRATEPTAPLFPNRRRGGYTHGARGSKVEGSEAHGALDWSEPIEPSAFYRNVFKPALVAAGLPAPTRLHDLRHTAFSLLLANGADPYWVSEQAGHSSYRVTLDVYAHFIPGDEDAPHPLDVATSSRLLIRD
jgi:integrase